MWKQWCLRNPLCKWRNQSKINNVGHEVKFRLEFHSITFGDRKTFDWASTQKIKQSVKSTEGHCHEISTGLLWGWISPEVKSNSKNKHMMSIPAALLHLNLKICTALKFTAVKWSQGILIFLCNINHSFVLRNDWNLNRGNEWNSPSFVWTGYCGILHIALFFWNSVAFSVMEPIFWGGILSPKDYISPIFCVLKDSRSGESPSPPLPKSVWLSPQHPTTIIVTNPLPCWESLKLLQNTSSWTYDDHMLWLEAFTTLRHSNDLFNP